MESEKSIGTILKEKRESKGLTLMDIERGTSIRSRYIQAVENDEYEKTPGGVFLKGIIRNYGDFLGLDGMALLQRYKGTTAGKANEKAISDGIREVDNVRMNIQLKDKRDLGSGTGGFEMPSLPKIPVKQCLAGLAVVAVLGAGYVAIPKAIDYVKNLPSEPKQEEKAAASAEQNTAKAPLDKVVVEMEASGSCWTEVTADGKEIFAGMLQAKEKKTFEAKDKLIVKYGNIGVMNIKVNGEPVNLNGEHGVAVKTYLRAAAAETSKAAEAPAPKEEEATAAPQPEQSSASAPAAQPEPEPEPAPAPEPEPKAAEPAPAPAAEAKEAPQPAAAAEQK